MLKISESGTYAIKDVRKTEEKITSLVTESIIGREELHILKAENKILQKLAYLYMELFKYKKAFRLKFIFTVELNNFMLLLEKCGLIIFLFSFYKNNVISLGQSFMLYNYFMFLEQPIQSLAENSTPFQGLSANISRVFKLLNEKPKMKFGSKKYVSQEITLFYASIRDNIRMFDTSIRDEQINAALKRSGMYEKISALPGGFDYICEDGGANFSSGETQLLALYTDFFKEK